jgi:single-strand DNA-binding protein
MNKFFGLGRLTKDVEIKNTPSGMAIGTLTVAIDRDYKKPGEEKKTDFLRCKAFGKTAENINTYFKKGSRILIIGKVQVEQWEKDGEKKSMTEIVVDGFEFVDSKKDSPAPSGKLPIKDDVNLDDDDPYKEDF